MNTQTQEALKMAITQFERIDKEYDCTEIIDICKEALEQPAQEPVEKYMQPIKPLVTAPSITISNTTSLSPPSWQGLSNDRIRDIGDNCLENNNGLFNWIDFAHAIEQALKEKNT